MRKKPEKLRYSYAFKVFALDRRGRLFTQPERYRRASYFTRDRITRVEGRLLLCARGLHVTMWPPGWTSIASSSYSTSLSTTRGATIGEVWLVRFAFPAQQREGWEGGKRVCRAVTPVERVGEIYTRSSSKWNTAIRRVGRAAAYPHVKWERLRDLLVIGRYRKRAA